MNESEWVTVTVNGDQQKLASGATIADLIVTLDLVGKRVAVERNLEIVPKSDHASTALQSDDVLEIVHAIGGG
jgi:sulfur carrier protein